MTDLERYEAKVDRTSGRDACHPWKARRNARGYGQFRFGERKVRAHRWGYEHLVGPIPAGQHVLHSCDNPACQNPRHWFLGTHLDNMRDMAAKGRRRSGLPGAANLNAKLSPDQVVEIRQRYAAGGTTHRALAEAFGISRTQVRLIVTGRNWRDLAVSHKEGPHRVNGRPMSHQEIADEHHGF